MMGEVAPKHNPIEGTYVKRRTIKVEGSLLESNSKRNSRLGTDAEERIQCNSTTKELRSL